ncbi:MAG: DNA polymerase III subunit beta [Alphaproteobacteria bacterium]
MKLTIERASLLSSLGHVQSVVERRNTIPILANVRLEAAAGKLTLAATDLDISIEEGVAAEIAQEGGVTAPAHTLYDIVRKLPEGAEVELAAADDGGKLDLRCGHSEFSLATLPREDFPVMAAGDLPTQFELSRADLTRIIEKTRFAISTEETRYYLNGIYLHATTEEGVAMLRAVATDGHRLAQVETPLPEGAAEMPGVIVPRKAVGEVRKLIEESESAVRIALSQTKIRFDFDGAVLISKLIDGTFPDYSRVIPTANDKVLEVDGKSFAAAVDRVSTISTEKSRAVKLSLDKGRLVISASSPENDTATEELTVAYDAPAMEIGFNSRYLLDIASQIDGENARFTLADAVSPTLVRDGSDESVLYVLMPMRV